MKQTIKSAYSSIIWGSWLTVVAIVGIVVWAMFPLLRHLTMNQALLSLLGIVVLFGGMLGIPAIVLTIHYRKLEQYRRAAFSKDEARTRAMAFPPRLMAPELPIETRVQTATRDILIHQVTGIIFGVIMFTFLGISFSTLDSVDFDTTPFVALMLGGAIFIASLGLYVINNDRLEYHVVETGMLQKKMWNSVFIPWSEIRLFYSLNKGPIIVEDLLTAQKSAQFEIASRKKRIILSVMSSNIVGKYHTYVDESQTYSARMADMLYVIAMKAGVELREKRAKEK